MEETIGDGGGSAKSNNVLGARLKIDGVGVVGIAGNKNWRYGKVGGVKNANDGVIAVGGGADFESVTGAKIGGAERIGGVTGAIGAFCGEDFDITTVGCGAS